MVWKRVGIGGGDGRDVVFVAVHNANDLVCGFLQRLGHGAANFDDIWSSQSASSGYCSMSLLTSFCSRLGEGNVQRPLLPANILVCFAKEVRLSSSLLEELYDQLPSPSLLMRAFYRSDQSHRPLVDQGF